MKYKDYYQVMGLERSATPDEIKKAYRKLAHQYHPDISKDPAGEAKFKDLAEAYATLKDPEKRAEYDALGKPAAGGNFTPPPEWRTHFGAGEQDFEDVDLADIFRSFGQGRPGGRRGNMPQAGEDYSVTVPITLEQSYRGGDTDVTVELPEYDQNGLPHRVARTFRVNIPKGASDGQRLRLAGKGGPGRHGGKPGDLYIVLSIAPHALYRLDGRDLYLDLPLSPAEAALGATVEVPTPGGMVELNIKPGTSSGQRLRLARRGLPGPHGTAGDLYAVVQIIVPKTLTAEERALYERLAAVSSGGDLRKHLKGGAS